MEDIQRKVVNIQNKFQMAKKQNKNGQLNQIFFS